MTTPSKAQSNTGTGRGKVRVKPAIRIRPQPKSLPATVQGTLETPSSSSSTSNSIKTQIMIQLFQDHIFIILSQRQGKLGSLFRCTVEHSVIDNTRTYEVTPLLGATTRGPSSIPDIGQVYARNILQRIVALDGSDTTYGGGAMDHTPLLLGVSLVEGGEGKETFDAIVGKVLEMYNEAIRLVSSESEARADKST